MKKICILIAMLCMCFLIIGCGDVENTDTSSSLIGEDTTASASSGEHTDMSSKAPDEGVDSSLDLPDNSVASSSASSDNGTDSSVPSDGGLITDPAPFGPGSGIEDYYEFMETFEAPVGFVRYEDIADWGEYYCMYFISAGEKGDYSKYRYVLIDKTGFEFCLDIYQNKDDYTTTVKNILSADMVNEEDMRRLEEEPNGIYEIDGISYRYIQKGELLSISWDVSGKKYNLWSTRMEVYPTNPENDTIIQKLLNLKTAKDALIEMFGEEFSK